MTITMTPKLEKALSKEAQKHGTTPEQLALDRLSEFFVSEEETEETLGQASEGSAYDLFAGRIGRITAAAKAAGRRTAARSLRQADGHGAISGFG